MQNKKIAVIGAEGKTGTMFAFELRDKADVLAVGREKEVNTVKEGNLYVEKVNGKPEFFKEKIIKDVDFDENFNSDIIFLAIKNPIYLPLKFYYQKFKSLKGKIPTLLISQNGILAIDDAKKALFEIFGEKSENIRIVRVILFNPINGEESEGKTYIKYSLPIKIAVAKASGPGDIKDIIDIFKKSSFEVKEFPSKEAKNLEFSKLFLNLIGMASASRGCSIKNGFKNKEFFKEEVGVLKEYVETVRSAKGKFLNLPHYPVKFLAFLFSKLPIFILLPFRNIFAEIVSGGREGKPKSLDEIDYYNGAVVFLGKKFEIKTLNNERVCKRVAEKLSL